MKMDFVMSMFHNQVGQCFFLYELGNLWDVWSLKQPKGKSYWCLILMHIKLDMNATQISQNDKQTKPVHIHLHLLDHVDAQA